MSSTKVIIWVAINLIGMVVFLLFASKLWAPVGASDFRPASGGAIVWVLTVLPILAISAVGNLFWLGVILFGINRRENKIMFLVWVLVLLSWFGLYRYDNYRQYDWNSSAIGTRDI